MRIRFLSLSVAALGCALSACGNLEGANLLFGQQQTVGLTIAGSTTDQGGELTLGFKDRNLAIVPVAVKQEDGSLVAIRSVATGNNAAPFEDAMSVLGQFDLKAGTNTGPNVGLGKFFATGMAARVLAEGFADKLAGSVPGNATNNAQ